MVAIWRSSVIRFGVILLFLLVSGCALSDEPPILTTAQLPTSVPVDKNKPVERIDLAVGEAIYRNPQRCVGCHGEIGAGDGPVSASIQCKITSFAEPAVAQTRAPLAWFSIVTNGNKGGNQCPMPPWANTLSEPERWAVTSYAYSLHYTTDLLKQGQQVWEQQQCDSCHTAGNKATPLTDPAALITQSDTQLIQLLAQGLADGTHKYDKLSDAERAAVVAYTRALTWDNQSVISGSAPTSGTTTTATPIATAATTAETTAQATVEAAATVEAVDSPTITVTGKLTNGSSGAIAPSNIPVRLRIIKHDSGNFTDVSSHEGTTDAQGNFTLKDIPRNNGMFYIMTVDYSGVSQNSRPVLLEAGSGPTLDLPLEVYETTTDPSTLHIDEQVMFIDFTSPTMLLIQQGISLLNTGDRIFVGNGDSAGIAIPLPAEAKNVRLSTDSQNFQLTLEQTPTLRSATSVAPGNSITVQFAYDMPFNGSWRFTQPTPYSMDSFRVNINQTSGALITEPRFQQVQGVSVDTGLYNSYAFTSALPAGHLLDFTVRLNNSGEMQRSANIVVIAASVVILLLTVAAIAYLGRRRVGMPPAKQTRATELLEKIAELDVKFEKRKIKQDAYNAEKERLKAELMSLYDN